MRCLIRILLSILALPVFSRTYGWFTRRRHPRFIIKKIISLFKSIYGIDMKEYKGDVDDYASLSDFFVRPLNLQNRLLVPVENAIVSPADGILQSIETVYEDQATQAKGRYYMVTELIQEKIDLGRGWRLITIYLSPSDYHRFHYPVAGTLSAYCHVGSRIFPVNSMGLNLVDKLFIRNERVICRFQVRDLPFYMVAVGATFVGSIKMEFVDKVRRSRNWKTVGEGGIDVKQLTEMGRFALGSTIILLFPEAMGRPVSDRSGNHVRVGDPLINLTI